MTININFADVPTTEPVPAGDYLFIVENVVLRSSKDKIDPDTQEKSQYLNWELTITEGPFEGRRIFMMTSLVKKALWKLRSVLVNLDSYNENFDLDVDEDTNAVISPELVGLVGVVRVKMGMWDGKERSEVDTILDIDGVDRERAGRTERKAQKVAAATPAPEGQNGAAPAKPERAKMTLR